MKLSVFKRDLSLIGCLLFFCTSLASSLSAATLTWSAGSFGDWNTSTPNWNAGTTIWQNNAAPDDAVFSNGGGSIVTLTENITAGTVNLQTNNHGLGGAAGVSLTFNNLVLPSFFSVTIGGALTLNANAAHAVHIGTQNFSSTSILNAIVAEAVDGGTQVFSVSAQLNAMATGSVSSSAITLRQNSFIQVSAPNALTSTAAVTFDSSSGGSGGILRLNGNSTTVGRINSSGGAGIIENASPTAATLTLGNTLNSDFSGVIRNGVGAAALSLVKTNSGMLTISGANTYTGGTTLAQGTTLISNISGSAFGTGSVILASGATLTGAGSFTGSLEINGTYSPGNNIGTGTTGSETWKELGNFLFEINDATGIQGTGNGWDLANINGTLTINSTVLNPFTLSIVSLGLNNETANFDNLSNYTWTIATTTGGIVGDLNAISLDTTNFMNDFDGIFSLGTSGNNLQLFYSAPVPEPSTWALVILGLGGLFWLQRTSKKA